MSNKFALCIRPEEANFELYRSNLSRSDIDLISVSQKSGSLSACDDHVFDFALVVHPQDV